MALIDPLLSHVQNKILPFDGLDMEWGLLSIVLIKIHRETRSCFGSRGHIAVLSELSMHQLNPGQYPHASEVYRSDLNLKHQVRLVKSFSHDSW